MWSSSEYNTDLSCTGALDGMAIYGAHTMWRVIGTQDLAPWIEVLFIKMYNIQLARIMQNPYIANLFRDLKLTFSDLSFQNMTLSITLHQFDRHLWEEFELKPVNTSFVRIDVLSFHTHALNGFLELEFYTASNECQEEVDDCHLDATCVDIVKTPGFLCPCNFGFYGDGKINAFDCQALNHSVNIVLATHGGVCDSSSSEHHESYHCKYAIDGNHGSASQEKWLAFANDPHPWMSVTFNGYFLIDRVHVLQNIYIDQQFKQLSLEFIDSSSPSQRVILHRKYYNQYIWEDFALNPVNGTRRSPCN